jgi:hypothetical protein
MRFLAGCVVGLRELLRSPEARQASSVNGLPIQRTDTPEFWTSAALGGLVIAAGVGSLRFKRIGLQRRVIAILLYILLPFLATHYCLTWLGIFWSLCKYGIDSHLVFTLAVFGMVHFFAFLQGKRFILMLLGWPNALDSRPLPPEAPTGSPVVSVLFLVTFVGAIVWFLLSRGSHVGEIVVVMLVGDVVIIVLSEMWALWQRWRPGVPSDITRP